MIKVAGVVAVSLDQIGALCIGDAKRCGAGAVASCIGVPRLGKIDTVPAVVNPHPGRKVGRGQLGSSTDLGIGDKLFRKIAGVVVEAVRQISPVHNGGVCVINAAIATGQSVAHDVNGGRACPVHEVAVKLAAGASSAHIALVGLPVKVVAVGTTAENRAITGLRVEITDILLGGIKVVPVGLAYRWKLYRKCNRQIAFRLGAVHVQRL